MSRPLAHRCVWLIGLACVLAWSVAASAQTADRGLEVSDIVTIQNVVFLAGLVFHFGILRQELRQMRADIGDLQAWRREDAPRTFARTDVTDAHMASIDERLARIESALKEHSVMCPIAARVERIERALDTSP